MSQQADATTREAKQNSSPRSSRVQDLTDIASIMPKSTVAPEDGDQVAASRGEEESKLGANATSMAPARRHEDPFLLIKLSTTIDMVTDVEISLKPFEPSFNLGALKKLIRDSHRLDDDQDFEFIDNRTKAVIEIPDDSKELGQTICQYENESVILALLNERFQLGESDGKNVSKDGTDSDVNALGKKSSGKEEPVNLERQIRLDPTLSQKQKEAAIKEILQNQFPDIVHDRIGGHRYNCFYSKCRKTYQHLKQLFEHQKIHLKNYRPFDCTHPGCNKSFMSKGHLRNHMDTHQAQKTFKCPIEGCNESYSRQQRLKVHLKKHEGKRDFVCPFQNCQKAFYEKGNLKTHLRLHTGEKPYHCPSKDCDKSFATQGHLNDHFAKNHKDGVTSQVTSSLKSTPEPRKTTVSVAPTKLRPIETLTGQIPGGAKAYLQPMKVATEPSIPHHQQQHELNLRGHSQSNQSMSAQSNHANLSTGGYVDQPKLKSILQAQSHIKISSISSNSGGQPQQSQQPVPRLTGQVMQTTKGPPQALDQLQQNVQMAQPSPQQQNLSMTGSGTGSGKRKKFLKINISAANKVADDVHQYNTNSVPKPIDLPSVEMREEIETKSLAHERGNTGSAGKNEISTDFMPIVFSFKDYEQKIGQTRGANTCIKIENRTLNSPTPIKANPEVHLDSQSLSHSQQSKQKAEQASETAKILKRAFGLQPKKSKSEFLPPPAKTPLNPSQLAKRRFFANETAKGDENGGNSENVDDSINESLLKRKRLQKQDQKMAQSISQAIGAGPYNRSVDQKSFDEKPLSQMTGQNQPSNTQQQNSVSGVSGSGPTFAPRQNTNKGSHYTMGGVPNQLSCVSQASNVMASMPVISESGGGEVNKTGADRLSQTNPIPTKESRQDEADVAKNSRLGNDPLTLKDLKVIYNGENDISLKNQEDQATMINQVPQISQYAQATATCVKKPNTQQLFFGPVQQEKVNVLKAQTCDKMPEKQETFFNQIVLNESSKQTPRIFEQSSSINMQSNSEFKRSFDNLMNPLPQIQEMVQFETNQKKGSCMELPSNISSSNLMTPLESRGDHSLQKAFNFQQSTSAGGAANQLLNQKGTMNTMQQILASPYISNNSGLQNQPNNQQLMTTQQILAAAQRSLLTNNNRSSSGSKGINNFTQPKIGSSSLTDRTPSSIRWDKSHLSVSPISQYNNSNPSVFFGTHITAPKAQFGQALSGEQVGTATQGTQFKSPIQAMKADQSGVAMQPQQSTLSSQQMQALSQQQQQQYVGKITQQSSQQQHAVVAGQSKGVQTNISINHQFACLLVQAESSTTGLQFQRALGAAAAFASNKASSEAVGQQQITPANNAWSIEEEKKPAANSEKEPGVNNQQHQQLSKTDSLSQKYQNKAETSDLNKNASVDGQNQTNALPKMQANGPQTLSDNGGQVQAFDDFDEVMSKNCVAVSETPAPKLQAAGNNTQKRSFGMQFDIDKRSEVSNSFMNSRVEQPGVNDKSSNTSSGQQRMMSLHQLQQELIKRKAKYQTKISQIEYKMYMNQSKVSMKEQVASQGSASNRGGGAFFTQPILSPENFLKLQQQQQALGGNLGAATMFDQPPTTSVQQQWLNWQRCQQKQFLQQQQQQQAMQQQMQQAAFQQFMMSQAAQGPQMLMTPQPTMSAAHQSFFPHKSTQMGQMSQIGQLATMGQNPAQMCYTPTSMGLTPQLDASMANYIPPSPQSQNVMPTAVDQNMMSGQQFMGSQSQMFNQGNQMPQQMLRNLMMGDSNNPMVDANLLLGSLSSSSVPSSSHGTLQMFNNAPSGGNSTAGFQIPTSRGPKDSSKSMVPNQGTSPLPTSDSARKSSRNDKSSSPHKSSSQPFGQLSQQPLNQAQSMGAPSQRQFQTMSVDPSQGKYSSFGQQAAQRQNYSEMRRSSHATFSSRCQLNKNGQSPPLQDQNSMAMNRGDHEPQVQQHQTQSHMKPSADKD